MSVQAFYAIVFVLLLILLQRLGMYAAFEAQEKFPRGTIKVYRIILYRLQFAFVLRKLSLSLSLLTQPIALGHI